MIYQASNSYFIKVSRAFIKKCYAVHYFIVHAISSDVSV